MNIAQAKQIKIEDFLGSKNIRPDKSRRDGSVLIYKAPYRNENNPSMEVDTINNKWYDFADANGGDILNLVMKIGNTDTQGALKILTEKPHPLPFSFSKQKSTATPPTKTINIIEINQLTDVALISYIMQRKISTKTAKQYLKEIIYEIRIAQSSNSKKYFAIGFRNDKGGYELRNKYFQGCTSKHFTIIPGTNNNQLNIFEGFFDFLAALEINNTMRLKFDSLILNSVALKEKTKNTICKYEKLNLFLDNDPAGKIATDYFQNKHPRTHNYSMELYANFKDFNEYLIKN